MKNLSRFILIAALADATARGATVSYNIQTGGYQAEQGIGTFHGIFNNGATEIGQFSNGGGTDGSAGFWLFTTNGSSSGTYRGLQIGDEFSITNFRANNPGNFSGIGFNDNTNASSYNSDRLNNNRLEFAILGSGNFKTIGTTTNDSGFGAGSDRGFSVKPTSSKTFNVRMGTTTYFDMVMKSSPGPTNRIRQFVIYLEEDNGNNSFWKNGNLSDSGTLEIGGGNGSSTFDGQIDDGYLANSVTTITTNTLIKSGSGAIILDGTNNYSGGTQIRAGTITITRDRSLGAVPASAITNVILTNNLSSLAFTNEFSTDANRTILLAGPAGNSYFLAANPGSSVTIGGDLVGVGNLVKNQDGTLILGKGKIGSGGNFIDRGTLHIAGGALNGGSVEIGTTGGDSAQAAALGAGIDLTNNIVVNAGAGARDLLFTSGVARIVSGVVTQNNKALTVSVTTLGTISGQIKGTGRVEKTGSGLLTLDGTNTYLGRTAISVGTLQIGSGGTSGTLGSGDVTNDSVLVFNRSDTVTVASVISGPGVILQRGAGGAVLAASNSHTGVNGVEGGTLAIFYDRSLGVIPAVAVTNVIMTNSSTLSIASNITLHANRTVYLSGPETNRYRFHVPIATFVGMDGDIAGPGNLVKSGDGTLVLGSGKTSKGNTYINNGVIEITGGSNMGGEVIEIGSSTEDTFAIAQLLANTDLTNKIVAPARLGLVHLVFTNSATKTLSGEIANSNVAFTIGANNTHAIIAGAITGTGHIETAYSGKITFKANNTFSGGMHLSGTTLNTENTDGSASGSGTLRVDANGILMGTGRVSITTIKDGGIIAPGTSPGTLTVGDTQWGSNGFYRFEINDFNGAYGSDPGWDRINCTGTLSITTIGTGALERFTVELRSLTHGNIGGIASNFVPTSPYTQHIASAHTITGFDTNVFIVDTANFTNTFSGTWTVALINNTNIALVYSVQASDIALYGNGLIITNNDNTPALADHTEFGTAHVATGLITRTFTITNTAATPVGLGTITTSGTHAAEFIVISQPTNLLDVGAATTFQVQFNPTAVGTRTATISFTNTVSAKSPFSFGVQGDGVYPGIGASPASFSPVAMVGDSVPVQTFGVTNVGTGTLDYTITVASLSNFLAVATNAGSLGTGAGKQHTNTITTTGFSAGTYGGTNTITDPAASNSPQLVTVLLTLTNIPSPTSTAATADGNELVRLTAAEAAGRQILIFHSLENSSADIPTNGSSYSIGNLVGNSRVIAKFTGSSTVSNFEHVVAAGTTNYYRFHAINNAHYSLAATASATMGQYLAGEIVDQIGYTNAVVLKDLNGGQGFTSAWSLSVPNTNADAVVDAANFSTFQNVWPAERGNRVVIKTTNTSTYAAFRDISTISCGKIYIAALMRRQFDEGSGDNKFQLLSFMNGSTEVAAVGKRGAGDDQFGVRANAGVNLLGSANSFPNATDHLVIGRLDLDTGIMSGIYYDNATSVPSNEPAYLVTATGSIAQVTGIRIAAGSAVSGWPGECHFDELRVARSWGELLNLLPPKVTAFVADGDNAVTDAQMLTGTFELRADLESAAGLDTDGAPFAPHFDILAPGGASLFTDSTFDYFTAVSASSIIASDTTHAVSAANIVLGVHTVQVSAVSSNFGRTLDNKYVGNVCTGTLMTFTVSDDDATGPVHSGFTGAGRTLDGGTFTNYHFLSGFVVTGVVTDVGSGVYGGTSNRFVVKYQDGSTVTSGFFAADFADGGATSGGALSNTFNYSEIAVVGIYTMSIFSADFDVDRTGDSTGTTTLVSITVVDPTPAPGLGVEPLVVTHQVMLGDTATNFTLTITNGGIGTLFFTNYQTYGHGSGWLAINATNGSMPAAAFRVHTGHFANASFTSTGTFVATNRVDGNQTNAAQLVVVNLVVTNIPDPTATTATPDGKEMIRLTATEASGREVLIFHSLENTGLDFPTNGNSYSAGNVIGNSRVLFKFTGSASASNFEHVVAQGTTNFYRFYSINNARYSPGVVAGATAAVYRAFEIVEPFSYTNGQTITSSRNGGQGYTNAWSANSGTFTVVPNAFTPASGYPASAGNSITGNNASIFRGIPEVTSGKIYVAFQLKTDNGGGSQYSGMSFFDGTTEEKFIGEGFSQVNQLTVGAAASRNLANNTGYLVIAMYDFASDKVKALLYTNATESVPSAEPETWHSEETDATISRINRLRFESNVGTMWDEVRVATNWPNLFVRDHTYPYATNFVVNGGSDPTDQQVKDGTFSVVYHLRDGVGIESAKTLDPYFVPNFDLFNANAVQVLTNESFAVPAYHDGGLTFIGTDTAHSVVSAAQVTLGSYSSRWSAVNSNGLSTLDSGTLSNGTALTFNVVDDDSAAPVLGGFVVTGEGVGQVNLLQMQSGGWSITGLVQDAGSGVNENGATVSDALNDISPSFTIYNSTGTAIIVSQLFTNRPTDGGAMGSAARLAMETVTNTVTLGSLPLGVYTARVTVADNDEDRTNATERSATTVDVATFEVIGVPVLAFGPSALSYGVSVGNNPSPASQTFTVTNNGTGTLDYTNVIAYSSGASGWLTVAAISNALTSGASQIHTATVTSASIPRGTYFATNTIFAGRGGTGTVVVTLSVTNLPYLGIAPASFTYHLMLGDTSSNQTFAVTNFGDGALSYTNAITYGTGASGWFTATAATGQLAALTSQIHTGSVSGVIVAGAGTYVATNAVTSAEATNSPQRITVTAVVSNIPAPTSFAAVNDGNELVRLSVAEASGRSVLVFHSLENSVSDLPTNGTAYAIGDVVGNSRVVAKFIASATVSNFEHVVSAGTTNWYRFHTINGNCYSPFEGAAATTGVYRANIVVETMSYTQGVSLATRGGGTGWASNWVVVAGTYTARTNATTPNLIANAGYPTAFGNKIEVADPGNGGDSEAYRSFPNVTAGRLYVAYLMAYEFAGANKYAGLSFMSNATEKAFIGEVFSADKKLGIDVNGVTTTSTFDLNPFAGGGGDTGNVYLVVGRYDFATRELRTKAYYRTTAITAFEPQNWDATNTLPAGRMDLCNGVRIIGGAGVAGDGTVGRIFFDELRVATNWPNLLDDDATYPYVTNVVVNGGLDPTDAQVKSGGFEVVYHFRDGVGIESQKTLDPYFAPNFDLFNANGVQVLSNEAFSSFSYIDGGLTYIGTDTTHSAVSTEEVTLGSYTSRWSAVNSNGLSRIDQGALSNGTAISFNVVDDDNTGPVLSGFVVSGDGVGTVTVAQVVNGGWSFTGLVQDAGSGVNENGATVSDALNNISPSFTIYNSTGTAIIVSQLFTNRPVDGGAMGSAATLAMETITSTVNIGNVPVGIYTARVTVADNDEDRTNDTERAVTTVDVATFQVIGVPVLTFAPATLAFSTAVGANPSPDSQTFAVTNIGSGTLYYTNVITYGTNASGWLTVAAISNELGVGASQIHTGTVNSLALDRGIYVATNTIFGGRGGTGTVVVTLTVTSKPYMAVSPASLAYHVMLGSLSSNATFAVTNLGDGFMNYTNLIAYGSGASGWFSAAAATGRINGAEGQVHTGVVNGAILAGVGTYFATNFVTSDDATNSPQLITLTATVTNIPAPTANSATADGFELIRLTAAEAAGRQVIVFHSLETSGADIPTNGTPYSVGSVIGNSRAIAKFAGSGSVSNFEHVSTPGTTNHYRFFTINNDYYSPAVTSVATLGFYQTVVSIEQFAYTNGTSLSGKGGGSAWAGTWSVSSGGGWTNVAANGTPNFVNMPFYPTNYANAVKMSDAGNGGSRTASRNFTAYSGGKIYVSYLMAYDFSGAQKFAGLSLMSNGVEKAFIGELGSSDRILGLDSFGSGSPSTSAFNINAISAGTSADTGNVYLVVGAYDFATRELKTKAYYRTVSVPRSEPTTWDATATVDAGRINSVDGIRLIAGSSDAGNTIGNAWFDEVRVAPSWEELLNETRPYATNFLFGTTNYVADGILTGGTYSVVFDFYAVSGLSNNAAIPNVDIVSPSGIEYLTNQPFTSLTYANNGTSLLASNSSMGTISHAGLLLGVYTGRWSAVDSNGVGVANITTLSNGAPVAFTVVDDDTTAPLFGTSLGGRAMDFTIGGTNYGSGTDTNGIFAVTDGDLALVGAANPMKFIFNISDPFSGIQRANGGTAPTNLNFDVGAAGPTNIFATFSNGLSDADTTLATATSVFYHTSPFTIGGSGFSETGEVFNMISALTNRITVSVYNQDQDRTGDVESFIDLQAGSLVVTDDDTSGPSAELLYVGTNYTFGATNDLTITDADLFAGGSVDIAYRWHDLSGMFVTNTDLTKTNAFANQGNVNMNWDLTNSIYQVGTADRIHSPSEQHGHNGDLYVTNVLQNIQAVPFTNNALTTWFLSVSAQDHDTDRGSFDPAGNQAGTFVSYDRTIRTNQTLAFSVVDDDTTGPNAVTQSVILAIGGDWTNNLGFVVNWDTNGVVDTAGILGYRVATNAPADIFGGTNAGAGTSYVWTVTAAHEGTLTNFLYALDADADRTNDFMYGSSANFTTKLDRTPPAQVTNLAITITGVTDDSTQLKLTWSMLTNAGSRVSDGDPLSPWKTYVVFYTTDETDPTTNSASVRASNGPPDLGTNTTTLLVLSNLLNDTVYKMSLAGLDVAGNYGPLSSVVTQRTTGLIITQSVVAIGHGVSIRWNLKTNLAYDVIYQDTTNWANNLTNAWTLLRTVTNEFPLDTGTAVRTPPVHLGSTMRFYRVSATDQWRTNNPTRVATREIIVSKSFTLRPGENWLALHADPMSNTVAEIFGLDRLPTGLTPAAATRISWYSATNTALATNVIWLATSNHWIWSVGGSGIADNMRIPVEEAFNIEIPGAANQQLVLSGRLTTNTYIGTIRPGGTNANQETYSLRARPLPHRVTLGQALIKGALTGATSKGLGPDEIRILDNTSGDGSKISPRLRAWLNSTDNRFYDWNNPAVLRENATIEPGEAIIIIRRHSGERVFTNALPYAPPGRNINP